MGSFSQITSSAKVTLLLKSFELESWRVESTGRRFRNLQVGFERRHLSVFASILSLNSYCLFLKSLCVSRGPSLHLRSSSLTSAGPRSSQSCRQTIGWPIYHCFTRRASSSNSECIRKDSKVWNGWNAAGEFVLALDITERTTPILISAFFVSFFIRLRWKSSSFIRTSLNTCPQKQIRFSNPSTIPSRRSTLLRHLQNLKLSKESWMLSKGRWSLVVKLRLWNSCASRGRRARGRRKEKEKELEQREVREGRVKMNSEERNRSALRECSQYS